jgi:hypothetical protein
MKMLEEIDVYSPDTNTINEQQLQEMKRVTNNLKNHFKKEKLSSIDLTSESHSKLLTIEDVPNEEEFESNTQLKVSHQNNQLFILENTFKDNCFHKKGNSKVSSKYTPIVGFNSQRLL